MQKFIIKLEEMKELNNRYNKVKSDLEKYVDLINSFTKDTYCTRLQFYATKVGMENVYVDEKLGAHLKDEFIKHYTKKVFELKEEISVIENEMKNFKYEVL